MATHHKVTPYAHLDDPYEGEMMESQHGIDPTLLLEVLGQIPIVFNRIYIDVTGSVTAALWLAYAVYHLSERGCDNAGWFSKSQQEWELDTGLSRREQETARARLRALSLLEERRLPNQPLAYRIMLPALRSAMEDHAQRLKEERLALRVTNGAA